MYLRLHRQTSGMYIQKKGNIMSANGVMHDRFKLVNTFEIVVPEGYDHYTRLDSFAKSHNKEFQYFNSEITDANFRWATTKLKPGWKFKVKVFEIKEIAKSEDCMAKLRSEKAIFVGAQGASLVWEQKKQELPDNRWFASFDEKDALWKDAHDYHRVPLVGRHSGEVFKFDLGYFGIGWIDDDGICLLCFCDVKKPKKYLGKLN